jgi:hypothetical protein
MLCTSHEAVGNVSEDNHEHQPCDKQGQNQVEGLAAYIEKQGFAAAQRLFELTVIDAQPDADKRQCEKPVRGNRLPMSIRRC